MRILLLLLLMAGSVQAQTYLILSQNSTNYALAVSHRIWKLASPNAAATNVVTKYWTGYITHTNGQVAIEIPSDDTLKLAVNADTDDLPNAFVGVLTPSAIAKLKSDIAVNRGKPIRVSQFVPLEKFGNLRTKEQMTAAGWFPNP